MIRCKGQHKRVSCFLLVILHPGHPWREALTNVNLSLSFPLGFTHSFYVCVCLHTRVCAHAHMCMYRCVSTCVYTYTSICILCKCAYILHIKWKNVCPSIFSINTSTWVKKKTYELFPKCN